MAAATDVIERTSEPPHLRVAARVRELSAYREILANLVRKELKVKYTASVLGAVWSLLNPVVFLAVFTFVSKVLGNDTPDYPVYLLSGLLAWNLFSVSVSAGARSVIDNANLVKKVYFPREILPLATVGVALVDYVLQTLVLLAFMLATGFGFRASFALFPLAFLTLLAFTTAMTFLLAAVNVRYRDVQHLLGLGLIVWFWLTPIVYPIAFVQAEAERLSSRVDMFTVYLLNPLAPIVEGFHRALYGVVHPATAERAVLMDVSAGGLATILAIVAAASLALLWFAWRLYFRLSGDFAEEL